MSSHPKQYKFIDSVKAWLGVSPQRKALGVSFAYIFIFLFLRLLLYTENFLKTPFKELAGMLMGGLVLGYITFAIETRLARSQAIPHITSALGYSATTIAIKITTFFGILISLGVLATFQIEQWGGKPSPPEQRWMQFVGIIFLIPIASFYVMGGWKFTKPGSLLLLWAFVTFISALALYLWNWNFTWLNPVATSSNQYNLFLGRISGSVFLPSLLMMMLWIQWLVMLWPSPLNNQQGNSG